MLSKRKAMIGYGVYTLGKPLAKRKLRQQQASRPAEEAHRRHRRRRRGRRRDGRRARLLAQTAFGRRGVDRELEPADTVVVGPGSPAAPRRVLAAAGEKVLVVDRGGSAPARPGETAGLPPPAGRLDRRAARRGDRLVPRARGRGPGAARPARVADAPARGRGGRASPRARVRRGRRRRRSTSGAIPGSPTTSPAASSSRAESRSTRWARRRPPPRRPWRRRRFALGCEAKRILVARGRVEGLATDAGVVPCGRVVVAAGPRLRFLLRTAAPFRVVLLRGWLLETGGSIRRRPTRSSRPRGPSRRRWARCSPTHAGRGRRRSHGGAGLVSLLLGGRPAGHCLIGTSLGRSLLEEPEGPETVRRLAERAVRVAPHLAGVPVVASWSAAGRCRRTACRSSGRWAASTASR